MEYVNMKAEPKHDVTKITSHFSCVEQNWKYEAEAMSSENWRKESEIRKLENKIKQQK